MKTLVLGASGATGKLLVDQLLKMDTYVKALVRPSSNVPDIWTNHAKLEIIQGSVSEMSVSEMAKIIADCDAVASCLGHNLTLKGIYGKPRRLVTDAVKLVCAAIEENAPAQPVKVVLMNTTGNRNRDLNENVSLSHRFIVLLLRWLLPPQPDNEQAADHLRTRIGHNHLSIAWAAVRPDGLINEEQVSRYSIHPSPTRDPIFNAGKTSRINVGNFMARLIVEDQLWNEWKGQMPVIYNS